MLILTFANHRKAHRGEVMIASGYTLDLYCDKSDKCSWYEDGQATFTNYKSSAEAIKQAKKSGWKFNLKTGEAICPKCQ